VAGTHRHHAHPLAEVVRRFIHLVGGGDSAYHLHQLHKGNGIEKVQADEALRALGGRHQLSDGDRRRVAGENGVFLDHGIERGVHFALLFRVLDHGFNNQIAIGQVFPPRGALQPGTNSLRRILERALFGQLGQRFFNSGKALVQILLLHFQHGDVESRGRAYLRDPRAHQPATQNTDFSDLHKQSFLTTEDTNEYREKRIHKYQDPCANRAARDRVLQTFYDYRDALPPADARRRQPILLFSPPQLVKQGDDKPRSGRAQRMAQSNGPAIHVHLVTVQDQFLLHPQVLRRERFIHFHQVNVIELQAGFLKCKAYSRHRSAAHQLGLHSGDAPADQTSQRLEPALL